MAQKLNTNTSIVDYLKSKGQDSSLSARKKLGVKYGIDYGKSKDNFFTENINLMKKLKGEKGGTTGTEGHQYELMGDGATPNNSNTPLTDKNSPENVNNSKDANLFINQNQDTDFEDASEKNGETPPERTSTQKYTDMFTTLKEGLNPTGSTRPDAPNMTEKYGEYRKSYGITDMETELNDFKSERRRILDAHKEAVLTAEGKHQTMGVISGKTGRINVEYQRELDNINRLIEDASDELNTKYKVVENLMSFGKMDYDYAVDSYDKQFTQNLNFFNTIKGIADTEKSNEDKKRDDARANAQIIYNNISAGGIDLKNITADQKSIITKLELQAGLPVGFYQNIQLKNPKNNILSTTTRISGGMKYADILMTNEDGSLSIRSMSLGSADVSEAGDSLGEQKNKAFSDINAVLDNKAATTSNGEPVKDSNGYITPAGLRQIIKFGSTKGIDRKTVIAQYGGDLYPGENEDYAGYGLSAKEIQDLSI